MSARSPMVQDPRVAARAALDLRRAGDPQRLVAVEPGRGRRRRRIGQAGRQVHRVLDRLVRALRHERQHRVGRVTEQGQPPRGPHVQRRAVVQRPLQGRLHGAHHVRDQTVPAAEHLAQRLRIAGDRPGLARGLRHRHRRREAQVLPRRDRVAHEVPARAEPEAHQRRAGRVRQPVHRHQAPVDAEPGELRLVAPERLADGGVDAVGADHQLRPADGPVLEGQPDAVSRPVRLPRLAEAFAQLEAALVDEREEGVVQMRPVHRVVRSAVHPLALRAQRRPGDRPPAPATYLHGVDRHRPLAQGRAEAEPEQRPDGVRRELDPRPYLGEPPRLLVHRVRDTHGGERAGQRQAADAGADHRDVRPLLPSPLVQIPEPHL